MKLILNVVFVACSCFIFGQKVDTLGADKYFVEITTSDNLTIALKKLHRIKQNQSNWKVKPELFHGDNFQGIPHS